jgi:hypothetical protein
MLEAIPLGTNIEQVAGGMVGTRHEQEQEESIGKDFNY